MVVGAKPIKRRTLARLPLSWVRAREPWIRLLRALFILQKAPCRQSPLSRPIMAPGLGLLLACLLALALRACGCLRVAQARVSQCHALLACPPPRLPSVTPSASPARPFRARPRPRALFYPAAAVMAVVV